MEKQILEILMELQKGLTVVSDDITEMKSRLGNVENELSLMKNDLMEVKTDVQEIKETVNRIEISQNEDVIAILKVTKKNTELEFAYLNNRVTEMDKRIYILEQNNQN